MNNDSYHVISDCIMYHQYVHMISGIEA